MRKLPKDFDIKSTVLYKNCLENVKYIGNKELELNLERELRIAYEGYEGGYVWTWDLYIINAFSWRYTPQGERFWERIYDSRCPKEYED